MPRRKASLATEEREQWLLDAMWAHMTTRIPDGISDHEWGGAMLEVAQYIVSVGLDSPSQEQVAERLNQRLAKRGALWRVVWLS